MSEKEIEIEFEIDSELDNIIWEKYSDVYPAKKGYHVAGDLRIAQDVFSPELENQREIIVYLPPSYKHSDRRYPVLYLQDGQNLFDHKNSFAGEWYVDETLERMASQEGLEIIVVGVPNMREKRSDEYSPFHDPERGGGLGRQYVQFLAETLKPIIDQEFRTLPERPTTGIAGSSMGGLISLYAYFNQPEIFGFAGVMSPALWFAHGAIFHYVEHEPIVPGKIYLDAGTREEGGSLSHPMRLYHSRRFYGSVRRMKRILVNKGFRPTKDLIHVEDKWASHNESAWASRLPAMLRFFVS